MVTRIFGAPRQYIQGPGAISRLGEIAVRCRTNPLVIIDRDMAGPLGPALADAFAVMPPMILFAGQITLAAIEQLTTQARDLLGQAGDRIMIFGIGGGKALDAAKAVALRLAAEFVAVPTIASNDSPTGRVVAIYDEAYKLAQIDLLPANPEAVVVDTALIAQAPERFLRGGIGDAISKKFEAERAHSDGAPNYFGTAPLLSALTLADACYTTLRRHAPGGMRAAAAHQVTPDFEATVEAAVLMSGIAWESGGTSLAHAVVRGIARMPGAQASLHGEHVAYGLLVQLAIEQRSDPFLFDLMAFYSEIGQACTLAGLGIPEGGHGTLEQIAQWTHEGPKGSTVIVSATVAEVLAALRRVEGLAARAGAELAPAP